MDWSSILGGVGAGALLSRAAEYYFNRKNTIENRYYQEKREAYLGLLESLHRAAIEPNNNNSKNYALWQTRISLFGSSGVKNAAQGIVETNDGPIELRNKYFNDLLNEMRIDLKK